MLKTLFRYPQFQNTFKNKNILLLKFKTTENHEYFLIEAYIVMKFAPEMQVRPTP